MKHKVGAIYHLLLQYQYGIWTINLLRVIGSLRFIRVPNYGTIGYTFEIHGMPSGGTAGSRAQRVQTPNTLRLLVP